MLNFGDRTHSVTAKDFIADEEEIATHERKIRVLIGGVCNENLASLQGHTCHVPDVQSWHIYSM